MSMLTAHRFSVEEYYRMAETGLLKPDARVELLEGQIFDMFPIGPFHSSVVTRLTHLFSQAANARWLVISQNPLHLSDNSEPQPDLMLVRPSPSYYAAQHPEPADVFLLIEVADSSLVYDRNAKLPLYARVGIPEVWIVNLSERKVEVYREPHFLGYQSKAIYSAGGSIAPAAFPDATIPVADLVQG